jgi:AraC-like DNA-binding protein
MVADIHSDLVRPIPASTESLSLLVSYIGALGEMDALIKPEFQRLIVAHVNELIALTLGAKGDAAEFARSHGLRAARLVRVLQLIDAGILDARLSVATIAAQLGVTARYVQLLLEDSGQTFTQYVLRKRLEKAKELLVRDVDQKRKIAVIALEVGFADLSHFNRAFRRHFGDTPSGVRASSAMRCLKS